MLHKRFLKARGILDTIEAHGHKAYFVGGAIRDQLLARSTGDIDIATSASPQRVQQMFDKVIPVGIEHGTVIVRYQDESFEVTTFRVEGSYSDFRHPDEVHFVDQIEDDLARRDFTMNAIAMDKNGNFVDPFEGNRDIEREHIRTVGDPATRFGEDPLRMLRALRFSSQLGFRVETETFTALKNNIRWIEKIAIERITNELEKMFAGTYIHRAIPLFLATKMNDHLPLLAEKRDLVVKLKAINSPLHSLSEVIAIFHLFDQTTAIDQWVKEWKLSNKVKKEAKHLVDAITVYKEKGLDNGLVYRLPQSLHQGFLRLVRMLKLDATFDYAELKEMYEQLPIHSRSQLALNGNDIAALFPDRKKGPWINDLLSGLEHHVITGDLQNNTHELGDWIRKWNPPENN